MRAVYSEMAQLLCSSSSHSPTLLHGISWIISLSRLIGVAHGLYKGVFWNRIKTFGTCLTKVTVSVVRGVGTPQSFSVVALAQTSPLFTVFGDSIVRINVQRTLQIIKE